MVSMDHFRQEIRSRFELASAQGRQDLTIECGELYRSLSKLPVFDPWMIFCCNAMRAEMAIADRLVFDDSKTSLLTIHYALPRHQRPPLETAPAFFLRGVYSMLFMFAFLKTANDLFLEIGTRFSKHHERIQ